MSSSAPSRSRWAGSRPTKRPTSAGTCWAGCSITLTEAGGTTTGRRIAATRHPIAGIVVTSTGIGSATGTTIGITIDEGTDMGGVMTGTTGDGDLLAAITATTEAAATSR